MIVTITKGLSVKLHMKLQKKYWKASGMLFIRNFIEWNKKFDTIYSNY